MSFPERPRGEPGGVESAAAAVDDAAVQLGLASATLQQASGGMDWSGYAQGAYRVAGDGLSSVASTATAGLERVASIARRYAAELEQAQSEIDRLRVQHDEARERAAAARNQAAQLSGARAQAIDPVAATMLDADIARAPDEAYRADAEADELQRRAVTVRQQFDDAARSAAADLEGAGSGGGALPPLGPPGSAVVGGRSLAPGFGVPLSGLDDLAGVVPVHKDTDQELPGFGIWRNDLMAKTGQTEVHDLTNLILLGAPGAGMLGRVAAAPVRNAGRAALQGAGLQSSRKVGAEAARGTSSRVLGEHIAGRQAYARTLSDARAGALRARAEAVARLAERRAVAAENVLQKLSDAGVPLPPGTEIVIPELIRFGHMVPGYVARTLADLGAAGRAIRDALREMR